METLEGLQELAYKLEGAKEVAVDLEAHSFRSFQGFTCLMQISDRHEDYVIDVMKLWKHIGPTLAPMFANPQVCSDSSQESISDLPTAGLSRRFDPPLVQVQLMYAGCKKARVSALSPC